MRWLLIFVLYGFAAEGQVSDEIVTLDFPETVLRYGKRSVIEIKIDVRNGYHIQANETSDEFTIPTTLVISGEGAFAIGRQAFPAPGKFRLQGTDEYLDVYDGSFRIKTFVRTPKGTSRGKHRLGGKLSYQACDSVRCLAPRDLMFFMEVDVQ